MTNADDIKLDRLHDFDFPTFEKWEGRIRMFRMWTAILAFVGMTVWMQSQGDDWQIAFFKGLAGALIGFFIGWASSLWLFSEVYRVEVRNLEERVREMERQRMLAVKDFAQSRHSANLEQDKNSPGSAA